MARLPAASGAKAPCVRCRRRDEHDAPAVRSLERERVDAGPVRLLRRDRLAAQRAQARRDRVALRRAGEGEHEQVVALGAVPGRRLRAGRRLIYAGPYTSRSAAATTAGALRDVYGPA